MTPEERFWSKVNKTEDCWLWTGARTAVGWHGVFATDARRATRTMVVAHRYSWELAYGPVPDGLKVCHACDEPACVRPDHLWLGTQRANMVDASRKRRTGPQIADWSHCKRGHLFRPETTIICRSTGRRRCRVCHNANRRKVAA